MPQTLFRKALSVTSALTLTLSSVLPNYASAVPLQSVLTTASQEKTAAAKLANIQNFVVIYLENRSFDEMYGTFPGANGLANAANAAPQISMPITPQAAAIAAAQGVTLPPGGTPLAVVNPVNNTNLGGATGTGTNKSPIIAAVDPNFSPTIVNAPFAVGVPGVDPHPLPTAVGYLGTPGSFDPLKDVVGDPVHRFYEEQVQINGGKMNQFIVGTHNDSTDMGGLVMHYYSQSVMAKTKMWSMAQNYTLLDNFFHSAFGGSFLNHSFLICSCAFATDSKATVAPTQLDSIGMPLMRAVGANPQSGGTATAPASVDTAVSADGKSWINTARSVYLHTLGDTNNGSLVQPQTMPHIGDLLDSANVTWKWYSQWYKRAAAETQAFIANSTLNGNTYTVNSAALVTDPAYKYPVTIGGVVYNDAQYAPWGTIPLSTFNSYMTTGGTGTRPNLNNLAALTTALNFQWHHNPFAYFANLALGTPAQQAHLQDRDDLLVDIANNTLPNVSFYKPAGALNQHHGYTNLASGDNEVQTIVTALQTTNSWKNGQMMIIITYDENGGVWDHVAPPVRDSWGPGTRVPAIVISPAAKTGYIDHTSYDTGSILRTIEMRWGLPPLNASDAAVAPLTGMLK